MALLAALITLHQGLGKAVGHVLIPFKVPFCGVHFLPSSEERANDQYAGPRREERDFAPCSSVLICYERRWHYIYCHVSITKLNVAGLCSAASFGQTDAPRAWLGIFVPVCRRTFWQQTPLITGAVAVLHLWRVMVIADRYCTVIDVELTQINSSPPPDWMTNVRERQLPKLMISVPT